MLFQRLSVGHKSRFIGHGEKLELKNAVISMVTAFCSHGYPSQQKGSKHPLRVFRLQQSQKLFAPLYPMHFGSFGAIIRKIVDDKIMR